MGSLCLNDQGRLRVFNVECSPRCCRAGGPGQSPSKGVFHKVRIELLAISVYRVLKLQLKYIVNLHKQQLSEMREPFLFGEALDLLWWKPETLTLRLWFQGLR